jgi:hypothetical protein
MIIRYGLMMVGVKNCGEPYFLRRCCYLETLLATKTRKQEDTKKTISYLLPRKHETTKREFSLQQRLRPR